MPPKKKAYTPPSDLAAMLAASQKKYGDSIVRKEELRPVEFIPTGCTALDVAMGGGVPRGRITEFLGKPSSGKSSTLISAMIEAQRKYPDLAVAYVDIERTWTDEWAAALGLDLSRLAFAKPKYAEEAADIARDWIRSGHISLLGIDSIGGMERQETLYEKSSEDNDMGKNAQVITRMAKQFATLGNDSDTAIVIVNQYRADLKNPGYDKASGPMILSYATTCSVAFRGTGGEGNVYTEKRNGDDITLSYKIAARVIRSKLIAAGRTADYWFNKEPSARGPVGIDEIPELVGLAQMNGTIKPGNGSFWLLPDGDKVNGQAKLVARVREDLTLQQHLRDALIEGVQPDLIPQVEVEFVTV